MRPLVRAEVIIDCSDQIPENIERKATGFGTKLKEGDAIQQASHIGWGLSSFGACRVTPRILTSSVVPA